MSDEKKWVLYVHICPNGKRYVGITSNKPENRWRKGGKAYSPPNPKDTKRPFWNAIKKYGWNNIQHIIFKENLTKEEACELEKSHIKLYRETCGCYNVTDGGDGTCGVHHTEEMKENLRIKCSGKNNARYGIKLSEEERKRMSNAKKRYYETHEMHSKRKVYQYELSGKFFKEFKSATDAFRETGINRCAIGDCCKGKLFTAGGFMWSYEKLKSMDKYKNPKNISVLQYDLNANFIRRYNSAKEAAKDTNTNYTTLINCCKGVYKIANGYIWTYEGEPIPKPQRKHERKINQYDKETKEIICTYGSIKGACEKHGFGGRNISSCCRGKLKSAYGFIWEYAD